MLVLLAVVALSACGRRHDFTNEADLLRARVLDLEQQVGNMERANAKLEAKLARTERRANRLRPAEETDGPGSADEVDDAELAEIIANTPRVTRIDLSRLCHFRGAAGESADDMVVLYVTPEDDLARFVQMVGRLSVNVAVLPAAGAARTIAQRAFGPGEIRAAYRSGFTGSHYTIEVPIDPAAAGDAGVVDVRVTFEDGLTGMRHTAHREIAIP